MPLKPQQYFQDLILSLEHYWANYGCNILQAYDMPLGAATFAPSTLRALNAKPQQIAYTQACRRPTDGRYGQNPNRLGHYYQFQVVLKPSPNDIQNLYLKSLNHIGIDLKNMIFASLKIIGSRQHLAHLGLAGKCGLMVWR